MLPRVGAPVFVRAAGVVRIGALTGAVARARTVRAGGGRSASDQPRPTTPGHYEGDLITGKAKRSAIATLVERASGYTLLVHLPGRHTAEVTTIGLIAAFSALPPAYAGR